MVNQKILIILNNINELIFILGNILLFREENSLFQKIT